MKKVVAPSPVEEGTNSAAPSTVPTDPISSSPSQQGSGITQPDAESSPPQTAQRQRVRPTQLPPGFAEFSQVIVPSVTVGAGAATAGALIGAVSAIVRSEKIISSSTVTAIQWFTLGSSYYGARSLAFKSYGGHENMTAWDKVKASGIAGGFAGMVGGLLRGPRNVIPGFIVWSLLGAGGQAVGGALSGRNFGSKYLASNWSPVTPLTDRQYEKMLEEKLLKIDAEIAIINDNIQEVRSKK